MAAQQQKESASGKRGFEDLRFYQEALTLLKISYELAKSLPSSERYNLADQTRRAALSVTNNIAEGYGRYHFADRIKFLFIARGSLDETLSCFIAAHAVGYCSQEQVNETRELVHRIQRGLNGYVSYIRRQQQGADLFGKTVLRESPPTYLVSTEFTPQEDTL